MSEKNTSRYPVRKCPNTSVPFFRLHLPTSKRVWSPLLLHGYRFQCSKTPLASNARGKPNRRVVWARLSLSLYFQTVQQYLFLIYIELLNLNKLKNQCQPISFCNWEKMTEVVFVPLLKVGKLIWISNIYFNINIHLYSNSCTWKELTNWEKLWRLR